MEGCNFTPKLRMTSFISCIEQRT